MAAARGQEVELAGHFLYQQGPVFTLFGQRLVQNACHFRRIGIFHQIINKLRLLISHGFQGRDLFLGIRIKCLLCRGTLLFRRGGLFLRRSILSFGRGLLPFRRGHPPFQQVLLRLPWVSVGPVPLQPGR